MSLLTGYPDQDILILSQLDDQYLSALCGVNQYAHSLCQDETLWFKKIQSTGYPEVKCASCESWRESYFWYKDYRNNYGYALLDSNAVVRMFSSFAEAQSEMMRMLEMPDDITQAYLNKFPKISVGIYFIKYGEEFSMGNSESAMLVVDSFEGDVMLLSFDALPWTKTTPFANIYINPILSTLLPFEHIKLDKFAILQRGNSPDKYHPIYVIFKTTDDLLEYSEDLPKPLSFDIVNNATGGSSRLKLNERGKLSR